jgi:carbon monoxide dehydrogenase subunit G
MKYTCDIIINKPIDEVLAVFQDAESLKHWQPGLVSVELLSGTAGQVGAKSKLKFLMGKKTIEMIETILVNDLPKDFTLQFETSGMVNSVKSTFENNGENQTKLSTYNEFQMNGFYKLLGWLMPGAFKKQSIIYLNHLKEYVETGKSVLE